MGAWRNLTTKCRQKLHFGHKTHLKVKKCAWKQPRHECQHLQKNTGDGQKTRTLERPEHVRNTYVTRLIHVCYTSVTRAPAFWRQKDARYTSKTRTLSGGRICSFFARKFKSLIIALLEATHAIPLECARLGSPSNTESAQSHQTQATGHPWPCS